MSLSHLPFFWKKNVAELFWFCCHSLHHNMQAWNPLAALQQRLPFRCSRTTWFKQSPGSAQGLAQSRHSSSIHFMWLNFSFSPAAILTSPPPTSKSSVRLLFFKFKLSILYFKPFRGLTSSVSPFIQLAPFTVPCLLQLVCLLWLCSSYSFLCHV